MNRKLCMLLCAFMPTVLQAQASTDAHAVIINPTPNGPCVEPCVSGRETQEVSDIREYAAIMAYDFLVGEHSDDIIVCIMAYGYGEWIALRGKGGDIASSILSRLSGAPAVSLLGETFFDPFQCDPARANEILFNPLQSDLECKWFSDAVKIAYNGDVIRVQFMGLNHERVFRGVVAHDKKHLKYVFDALYDHSKAEQLCQKLIEK